MQFDLYGAQGCERKMLRGFYGLNRTRSASAGELEDMKNMSSLEYPCAAPRGARTEAAQAPGKICAAAAPDSSDTEEITGFTGIADGAFWYNGETKSGGYELSEDRKWEIVRLGNLYIMNGCRIGEGTADSALYYYNVDTGDFGNGFTEMSDLIVTAGKDSTGNYLQTFRYGFDEVYNYSVTDTHGREIKNSVFFDKYGSGLRLPASNIFEKYFAVGDEITIEGFPTAKESVGQVWSYSGSSSRVIPQNGIAYDENNTLDTDVIKNPDTVYSEQVVNAVVKGFKVGTSSLSGMTLYIHYIYFDLTNIKGNAVDFYSMSTYSHYCSGVRLSKKRRTFNHIAAHHNRLWGTVPSGNTIYASASDDIFSFSSSDIISKYAARIESDKSGVFTGICEYGSYLLAFKESSITVIYGDNAANYGTEIINGIGCIAPKSVTVTPRGVIFLSYKGFYIYNGNAPSCISTRLKTKYKHAVGGFDGNIYYVCAQKQNGEHELLTYDTRYGLWHRQDGIKVTDMFTFLGEFYLVSGNKIYRTEAATPSGSRAQDDADGVKWKIVSAKTYDNTLDNKSVNELWIRAYVEKGAYFIVCTRIDDGEWQCHESFSRPGINVFRSSVRTHMGSSYQYKIEGCGNVVFYEIEVQKANGGRTIKDFSGTTRGTVTKPAEDIEYSVTDNNEFDFDY